MRTAILFSGGKDSCLAMHYAKQFSEVVCLITIQSENSESYMFHTPNINLAKEQAECIDLPIIIQKTSGESELELNDLKIAISKAISDFEITGVVTGAIESVYQASRIQKICNELNIECFNPLWQKDQFEVLQELIGLFDVIIIGTFGEGLDDLIGHKIDNSFYIKICDKQKKYFINPAGEGGELESFVLDAPFFNKKLVITKSKILRSENSRVLIIEDIKKVSK